MAASQPSDTPSPALRVVFRARRDWPACCCIQFHSLLDVFPLASWLGHDGVSLYMAVPPHDRYRIGLYRIGDSEARELYEQQLPLPDAQFGPDDRARQILGLLSRERESSYPSGRVLQRSAGRASRACSLKRE